MNAPGVDGIFSIPAALQLLRDPRVLVDRHTQRFGPVWTTRMPDRGGKLRRLYWLMGPDGNERILAPQYRDDFSWYVGYRYTMEPIFGRDILFLLDDTAGCPAHRERHRLLVPAFHPRLDVDYAPVIADAVERRVARWSGTVDLQWELKSIAFSVVARLCLGAEDRDLPALVRDFEEVGLGLFSVFHVPLPGTRFFRGMRARKKLAAHLGEKIAAYRARGERPGGMLGQLMEPPGDGGAPLDDASLVAEMLAFLFSGYDTTSSLLTSFFAALGDHPAERRHVEDELRALPDVSPASVATARELELALLETERLYPPLVFAMRGVVRGFEFRGYEIPAGEQVAYSAYYTGRLPELFERPEEFRPQRFADGKIPPYSMLAFGGGHRSCIGRRFARLEMGLVIAAILRRWDVRVLPRRDDAVFFSPTLQRTAGLPARVSPR